MIQSNEMKQTKKKGNEIPQGGSTANKQGKVLENLVRHVVTSHGYAEMSYDEWIKCGEPLKSLVSSVPYTTIYGTRGRTEFLLIDEENKKIRIECKWQQSSGSVDEKYPYTYECMTNVPEETVIILLDGGGYKKQARDWLKQKCDTCNTKEIKLFDMKEFVKWANKIL